MLHHAGNADSYAMFNLLTAPQLFDHVEELLPEHRERQYPPTETLSMFLAQALSADGSCQQAVNDAMVKRVVAGMKPGSTDTGAYCKARTRSAQIGQLEQALARAREAYDGMTGLYGDGLVTASVPGTVAAIPAAVGSVIREGEPVLEIMAGPRFILSYVNPGGLYRIQRGDGVIAGYGLRTLAGEIDAILPISSSLPQEFQKAFRPKDRAQVVRIAIRDETLAPPLLTKVQVRADSSLTGNFLGLLQPAPR